MLTEDDCYSDYMNKSNWKHIAQGTWEVLSVRVFFFFKLLWLVTMYLRKKLEEPSGYKTFWVTKYSEGSNSQEVLKWSPSGDTHKSYTLVSEEHRQKFTATGTPSWELQCSQGLAAPSASRASMCCIWFPSTVYHSSWCTSPLVSSTMPT